MGESIVDIASGAEDLSILVEAVVAAGLLDAVADPEAEFTVFAPTNEAFVELLGALGLDGLDDVPVDLLQEVLLYHVVPAVAFSTDLTDGQVLPTLNGAELVVDLSSGIVIDGIGSDATVLLPNIDAGDSVVHVIDAVLLPFSTDAEEPLRSLRRMTPSRASRVEPRTCPSSSRLWWLPDCSTQWPTPKLSSRSSRRRMMPLWSSSAP